MRFSVLSSGSKANATLVESDNTRILIDCGLSASRCEERLRSLSIDPSTLRAILVTHEHADHVIGISVLSRRYKLPVYTNRLTARALSKVDRLELVESGTQFLIGDLNISSFSISHDAVDPVGYIIESNGLRFAQATDLGRITTLVKYSLAECHALVLESNHDPEMLNNCGYPWELKTRISSTHGHLNNHTAAEFIAEILHPKLKTVVLAHLSENSNTPELAMQTFRRYVPETALADVRCASIHAATSLIVVNGEPNYELELLAARG